MHIYLLGYDSTINRTLIALMKCNIPYTLWHSLVTHFYGVYPLHLPYLIVDLSSPSLLSPLSVLQHIFSNATMSLLSTSIPRRRPHQNSQTIPSSGHRSIAADSSRVRMVAVIFIPWSRQRFVAARRSVVLVILSRWTAISNGRIKGCADAEEVVMKMNMQRIVAQ